MSPDIAHSTAAAATPIRVLVVDDQSFMRIALRQIIESDGDIRVIGEARNGAEAVALAHELKPDAITMDVEMPEMDGLEACARIVREVIPKPSIIMVSAYTQAGAEAAVRGLQLGAVDFVSKTSVFAKTDLAHIDAELRPKLRAWSPRHSAPPATLPSAMPVTLERRSKADLIVVAASTGGPQALTKLLKMLGPIGAPIVIALHIPEFFTASLAQMLSQDSGCTVTEGTHGLPLTAGTISLIPGGRDGVIARRRGGGYELRLVNVQANVHPSGNALLESAAMVGVAPVGVILTGMGDDAARGASALRRRNAPVLVQDPSSCVVDGMPRATMAAASDVVVLNLESMASVLADCSSDRHPSTDQNAEPSVTRR
jgi:two-component system chemotaxis response regulator CheB